MSAAVARVRPHPPVLPVRPLAIVVAVAIALTGCARPRMQLAPDLMQVASPAVLARVRADPFDYFRLLNHEWTSRGCELLGHQSDGAPTVQLHGDAHVEQFAFMKGSWGLDDFDDAARGPAFVDIVRFLGSVDLAARQRGWSSERSALFDGFFDGYRKGIADPSYVPPELAIVRRLKAANPVMTHSEFMAWAEARMDTMTTSEMVAVMAGMRAFGDVLQARNPDMDPGYFRVVRAGWLRMGIGSAANLKVLIRVAGPSSNPSDDVLLEAKAVRARDVLPCVEQPRSRPTFRIVQGSLQVGRLDHAIIVAGPEVAIGEMTIQGQRLRDWWIRSWDPSYHEIDIEDLTSVDDLRDIAYDAGVQLGGGALRGVRPPADAELRTQLGRYLDLHEARLRQVAMQLVAELLRGWRALEAWRPPEAVTPAG